MVFFVGLDKISNEHHINTYSTAIPSSNQRVVVLMSLKIVHGGEEEPLWVLGTFVVSLKNYRWMRGRQYPLRYNLRRSEHERAREQQRRKRETTT